MLELAVGLAIIVAFFLLLWVMGNVSIGGLPLIYIFLLTLFGVFTLVAVCGLAWMIGEAVLHGFR